MTFAVFNLLAPLVLAIHNLDECARDPQFVQAYHPRWAAKLISPCSTRYAAIAITLFVALLAGLTYVYRGVALLTLAEIAVFAMLLNGVGHCILSLLRRRMLPGTVTAATLLLPYTAIAVVLMRTTLGDSYRSLLGLAALGAMALPLAIILCLSIGYGLARLQSGNRE